MKALTAIGGPLKGQTFLLSGMTLIGREGDCNIQVLDAGTSRKHACVVEQDDGSVLLRDLASQNGTFIGEERIKERLLSEGDRFVIGKSTFIFSHSAHGEIVQESLEIKVMSGPAVNATVQGGMSAQELKQVAEMRAQAKKKTEPFQRFGAAKSAGTCCGSPLREKARAEGWAHCPACGAVL